MRKRVTQGWFTPINQDKPSIAPDFLCKVDSMPRSIIREAEVHFKEGASAADVMKTIGSTNKLVLSALYADILREMEAPPTRIKELVKATGMKSVKRIDLVARILELYKARIYITLASRSVLTLE